jgi:hypothetical protein
MTGSRSTLDDEVDSEPPADSRETCWFWDSRQGRCHYEPLVIGYGGPCADCPEEDAAAAPAPVRAEIQRRIDAGE